MLTDLLQSVTRFKLRQVLHSTMDLLQIATSITKCNDYQNYDCERTGIYYKVLMHISNHLY